MKKNLKIVILSVLIIFLALAGYFGYKKYFLAKTPEISENIIFQPEAGPSLAETPKKTTPKEITIFPGFKVYKNADFGFEIQYPSFWTVSEESIINVRGENTKGFFFKKPNSDLRFAILPRDGLSYALPSEGISEDINVGGFPGIQTKYIMPDERRLLLIHPQTDLFNWDKGIGRLDIQSSVEDPVGDFVTFNKMLNSFRLAH